MGTLIGLSMKEFGLELEELASKGVKFDVRSQGEGNIYRCLDAMYQFTTKIKMKKFAGKS